MRHRAKLVGVLGSMLGGLLVPACHHDKPPAAPVGPQKLTAADIAKRSTPAIVQIEAKTDHGTAIGTGFIVDRRGLIATNLHVVVGASTMKVHLNDGTELPITRIAGFDPDRDLALVAIDPKAPLPTLALGDSDTVVAGDPVVAIGNPLGVFNDTVSAGLISQVREVCSAADAEASKCGPALKVLQISAPISQGSSGGPLFDQFGNVVGVTTAIITEGQNINLAVPANYLKPLLARPANISVAEFAAHTRQTDDPGPSDGDPNHVHVVRKIPQHELKVLDGCTEKDLREIAEAIAQAIKSGAPLYNAGNHEACYRIYEGTAEKFEREAPCAGVRAAFGDGLLRAAAMESFTEKAWAMRDTFDGLIDVSERWMQANGKHATAPTP